MKLLRYNRFFTFFIILVLLPSPLFPMHQFAQRNIPHFFTVLYWYLAAGPGVKASIERGYALYQFNPDQLADEMNKLCTINDDQFDKINSLTQQVMQDMVPAYKGDIKIAFDPDLDSEAGSLPGIIMFRLPLPTDEEECKFIIGHEIQHIAHASTDTYLKHIVFPTLTPFIAHGIWHVNGQFIPLTIKNHIRHFLRLQKHQYSLAQLFLKNAITKIPKAYAISGISFISLQLYNSWRERVADMQTGSALGAPACLAGANKFEEMDRKCLMECLSRALIRDEDLKDAYKMYSFFNRTILYSIASGHPAHYTRMRYLRNLAHDLSQSDK